MPPAKLRQPHRADATSQWPAWRWLPGLRKRCRRPRSERPCRPPEPRCAPKPRRYRLSRLPQWEWHSHAPRSHACASQMRARRRPAKGPPGWPWRTATGWSTEAIEPTEAQAPVRPGPAQSSCSTGQQGTQRKKGLRGPAIWNLFDRFVSGVWRNVGMVSGRQFVSVRLLAVAARLN